MLLTLQNGWAQGLGGVLWDPHGGGCTQHTKAQVLGSLTLKVGVPFYMPSVCLGAPCALSSGGGGGGWWCRLHLRGAGCQQWLESSGNFQGKGMPQGLVTWVYDG